MSDARLCYHRHRRTAWYGPIPGMGDLILTCEDCGASVRAPYNTPLPDLVPLPVVDGTVDIGKAANP